MNPITNTELIIFGIANFLVAILSGISGSGGGFIATPLLIFLGLTPAQAVATGKLGGLSLAIGSLGGIRRVPSHSKRQVGSILAITLVIGLLAPLAIVKLDSDFYRRTLGFLLLAMIPILIIKKIGHTEEEVTTGKKVAGYFFLIVSLVLQAVFSGGMGTLVNIVLMAFLGMSALEANVTKRFSQLILNTVIFIGLFGSGLIVWRVGFVSIVSAFAGGFLGGKIATKRSNAFVMTVFIVLMFISAMELLFG